MSDRRLINDDDDEDLDSVMGDSDVGQRLQELALEEQQSGSLPTEIPTSRPLDSGGSPSGSWFPPSIAGPSSQMAAPPLPALQYAGEVPPIIRRYRNPETGYPDFELMKECIAKEKPTVSGSAFAERNRRMTRELSDPRYGTSYDRMRQVLHKKRGLKYIGRQRYGHTSGLPNPNPFFQWHPLQPSSSTAPDITDQRFHRSVQEMQIDHWPSNVMPRGRIGYGDLSQFNLNDIRQRVRAGLTNQIRIPGLRHEESEHWTPREVAFSERLRRLDEEDRRRYFDMQIDTNIDLELNKAAKKRMVPRPTIGGMRSPDNNYVRTIMDNTQRTHYQPRETRRSGVRRRANLLSAICYKDVRALPPISEHRVTAEGLPVPYTFVPQPADPTTNLIPTTRSISGIPSSTLASPTELFLGGRRALPPIPLPSPNEEPLSPFIDDWYGVPIEQAEEVQEDGPQLPALPLPPALPPAGLLLDDIPTEVAEEALEEPLRRGTSLVRRLDMCHPS